MTRLRSALVLLALPLAAAGQPARPKAEPPPDPNAPQSVLDPGGHAGEVVGVAFTPDGRSVVTAGDDRTVRVWDLATGDTTRVFRLPPAPAGGGLTALAVSPDGKTVAAGAWVTDGRRTDVSIHVFDLATGRLLRTLADHVRPVTSLSFGPGGKHLASGSLDGTVRVWDPAAGKAEAVLRGHAGGVFEVAFAPDGKHVASTAMDMTIRVWPAAGGDADLVLRDPRRPIASVAWSPNGKFLATGNQDGSVSVWDAAGKRLGTHADPRGAIWAIAFTPDGREVLCAGAPRKGEDDEGPRAAWLLDVANGQENLSVGLHTGMVRAAAVSPDGKLAATCGGHEHEAFVWRLSDGLVVRALRGRGATPYAVAWSPDGRTIAWGGYRKPGEPEDEVPLERTFHLGELRPGPAPAAGFRRAVLTRKGKTVDGWGNLVRVRDADDDLVSFQPSPGDRVTCVTWLDEDAVVVGTVRGVLLMRPDDGHVIRKFAGTGGVASVALAPDGLTFLTGGRDHVLRVWSADRPRPLLSLLPVGDEWVAWTDEGLYAASAGGERLMGWQVGTGPDRPATYHPAARFRSSLYRPDVVRHVVSAGGLDGAFAAAKVPKPDRVGVAHVLPPVVEVTAPTAGAVADRKFEVAASARPTAGRPVTALRLLVDGRPYRGRAAVKPVKDGGAAEVKATWSVDLPPGPHTLDVAADSAASRGVSAPVEVRVPGAGADDRPALYVLAVGAGGDHAAEAEAVGRAFREHGGKAYRSAEVRVLKDKEATRAAMEAGLAWLAEKATARDVSVFAFVGGAARDGRGAPALVPADGDPKDPGRTCLAAAGLTTALAGVPGRLLVVLDAGRPDAAAADDVVRELVSEECGAIVLRSGAGAAFAQALAEGLSGAADRDQDGVVGLNELDTFAAARVRDLTRGAHAAIAVRPAGVRSFTLARP